MYVAVHVPTIGCPFHDVQEHVPFQFTTHVLVQVFLLQVVPPEPPPPIIPKSPPAIFFISLLDNLFINVVF